MKKILTLITVLFITAPAYAQEYSKKELKSINKFDGINNLCFTINDILTSSKVGTCNILIGNPKEYLSSKKIKLKSVFENLIND